MMKNKLKILITGLFLTLVVGIVIGSSLLSGTSTISLSREDKTTLAKVGVTSPTISKLVCDGEICRACARQVSNDYGMGCISIVQKYCDKYDEETNECLLEVEYTDAELKANRDEAFKIRWEGIANTIRQRTERETNKEDKVDEGEITINEK